MRMTTNMWMLRLRILPSMHERSACCKVRCCRKLGSNTLHPSFSFKIYFEFDHFFLRLNVCSSITYIAASVTQRYCDLWLAWLSLQHFEDELSALTKTTHRSIRNNDGKWEIFDRKADGVRGHLLSSSSCPQNENQLSIAESGSLTVFNKIWGRWVQIRSSKPYNPKRFKVHFSCNSCHASDSRIKMGPGCVKRVLLSSTKTNIYNSRKLLGARWSYNHRAVPIQTKRCHEPRS